MVLIFWEAIKFEYLFIHSFVSSFMDDIFMKQLLSILYWGHLLQVQRWTRQGLKGVMDVNLLKTVINNLIKTGVSVRKEKSVFPGQLSPPILASSRFPIYRLISVFQCFWSVRAVSYSYCWQGPGVSGHLCPTSKLSKYVGWIQGKIRSQISISLLGMATGKGHRFQEVAFQLGIRIYVLKTDGY